MFASIQGITLDIYSQHDLHTPRNTITLPVTLVYRNIGTYEGRNEAISEKAQQVAVSISSRFDIKDPRLQFDG